MQGRLLFSQTALISQWELLSRQDKSFLLGSEFTVISHVQKSWAVLSCHIWSMKQLKKAFTTVFVCVLDLWILLPWWSFTNLTEAEPLIVCSFPGGQFIINAHVHYGIKVGYKLECLWRGKGVRQPAADSSWFESGLIHLSSFYTEPSRFSHPLNLSHRVAVETAPISRNVFSSYKATF